MSNRNILYTDIFVDELARAGLKTVCLAPGSRNTPLVMAFAKHPHIKVYSHLDERSAAFFALGIGMATGTPSAVVCTSGTAVANFFPAIVEATQSSIPLLVISADRPPELRDSGANQTIDQVKIFGDYPLWTVDLPTPEANPSALTIRYLRSIASRAVATTIGIRKGAVHINMPFRKPLEPIPVQADTISIPDDALARENALPYIQYDHFADDPRMIPQSLVNRLADLFTRTAKILVVCGTHCPPDLADTLNDFATLYPVIVDGASGLRLKLDNAITAYDTFLNLPHTLPVPDVVVRFGYVPTSNWLNVYLDNLPASTRRVHIHENGVWADDSYRTDWFIHADPADLLRQVLELTPLPPLHNGEGDQNLITGEESPLSSMERGFRGEVSFYTAWQTAEHATWEALASELATNWFDGAVVHRAVKLLPQDSVLYVGNSLPIRHFDQFGRGQNQQVHAYGMRGASGIDGNISVALGLGAGHGDNPLCAIIGDITAYHDMNGLLAVRRCGIPITLVVINNDGGGIFHRLPIAQFDPEFTDYFLTPHGLTFAPVAQLYGLDYANPQSADEFESVFADSIQSRKSVLIEVTTDSAGDFATRKVLLARVKEAVLV